MKYLIFLSIFLIGELSGQCVNENGNEVMWFMMLKMPYGVNYLYADNKKPELNEGARDLDDTRNPVARVLQPIYSYDARVNFILYNDAIPPPDGRTIGNRAHAKGALVWRDNSNTMQWLIHSVPHFPPFHDDDYSYPQSGEPKGQSFLCITMSKADLPVVSEYLYFIWPTIYEYRVSPTYMNVPNLNNVLNGLHVQQAPWVKIRDFTTPKLTFGRGVKFYAFAKAGKSETDIYKKVIAPYFQDGLYVQTWQIGGGTPLPSDCTRSAPSVWNVERSYVQTKSNTYEFLASVNHSKWAITANPNANGYVCVGDLNRMESQKKRGGGMVCFYKASLADQIRAGIRYYPC